MRKGVKNSLVTIIFLVVIVGIAFLIIFVKKANAGAGVTTELAQCIGQHSEVYVQAGCHFCAEQENLFGTNWDFMNSVDCVYTPQKCQAITGTPTWLINGQYYKGVQSIDTLKQLTGC